MIRLSLSVLLDKAEARGVEAVAWEVARAAKREGHDFEFVRAAVAEALRSAVARRAPAGTDLVLIKAEP